jgi:two-component system chemotaxis response regulator CheB
VPEAYTLEKPFSLSCPECGGVLQPDDQEGIRKYRCHIGHIMTGETVLAAQFDMLEIKLAGCLALLNERSELCARLAADARARDEAAALFEEARSEALARAETIMQMLQAEWVHPVGMPPGQD